MPSFDVVSQVNTQELDNAVNQTMREIGQRYDFRGSKSALTLEKERIQLVADDDYKARSLIEILRQKMAKRGIDQKAIEEGTVEPGLGGMIKCELKIKQGIPTEIAKQITKGIKELPTKVQAQIQDEQIRVTGKKKDDLQAVIAYLKAGNFDVPLQFINFRD